MFIKDATQQHLHMTFTSVVTFVTFIYVFMGGVTFTSVVTFVTFKCGVTFTSVVTFIMYS